MSRYNALLPARNKLAASCFPHMKTSDTLAMQEIICAGNGA